MKLRIKELREARGWTIDQLADAAGRSRGFVSQIENDKRTPGLDTLQQVARALSCRVVDLFDAGEIESQALIAGEIIRALPPEKRVQALADLARWLPASP